MYKISCCAFLILIIAGVNAPAQKINAKGNVAGWYKKYESIKALKIYPDESIDRAEFIKQYARSKKWWDEAFTYLKITDLSRLVPGNYQIDGDDVYVKVTEAISKDIDSSKWESHHNYHDIHCLVSGKEMIGITPVTRVTAITPYDSAKDILFYKGDGPYFLAAPDRFFIIFSNQAHRPFVKVGGYEEKVKRIVIKVRNIGYKE